MSAPEMYWAGKHSNLMQVGDNEGGTYLVLTIALAPNYDPFRWLSVLHDIEGDSPEYAALTQMLYNDCWIGK